VVTGSTISSTAMNNTLSDIASALTASIAADGQTPVTANLPMNSHKLTGLAAASNAGDALSYGQASMGLLDGSGGVKVGNSAVADSSTLDYYTENTAFSTVVSGQTTAGTATGLSTYCRYTRIGNRVMGNIFFSYTSHTGTGALQFTLPLTPSGPLTLLNIGSYQSAQSGLTTVGAIACVSGGNAQPQFMSSSTSYTSLNVATAVTFFSASFNYEV